MAGIYSDESDRGHINPYSNQPSTGDESDRGHINPYSNQPSTGDESDRGHINPYSNQPSTGDAVLQFTSPAQWKAFTGEKQGHLTSLHNSHGLITSPSVHNSHILITSASMVSQNSHTIMTSPAMVSHNNHTLMTSAPMVSHSEMMVNPEQKNVNPYASYYPAWPGHVHIPPVVGHSSFGQMLGSIEPSRVSVPISTHLSRQEIIPVLANAANSMPTVNMVGHLNQEDSVTVVAHPSRQDGVNDLPVVSHMSSSIHKEYCPSVVSSIHPSNIAITNGCVVPIGNSSNSCVVPLGHSPNSCVVPTRHSNNCVLPTGHSPNNCVIPTGHSNNCVLPTGHSSNNCVVPGGHSSNNCVVPGGHSSNNCVVPGGHSSNSVLDSITSCSYVKTGSVMTQIVNQKVSLTHTGSSAPITSSIYHTDLGEPMATANCGKSVNEDRSYSLPTVSSLCQVSQHQSYPKAITSISMTEQVVEAAQEDIVARALNQSLNPDADSVPKMSSVLPCGQNGMRENFSVQKSPHYGVYMQEFFCNVEKAATASERQPVPFDSVTRDSPVVDNPPPYNSSLREPFSTADKPVRRGPGRPPGSASAGDDPQEKPYKCEYCDRRFKHSQQRRVHIMSHTGERPHTCPYCQKGFKTLAQKTDHIRVHTGDKPYKCTICWREFGKYATMKKHLNTHLDTPPYQCTHCQKGFYLADRLKVHTREHTNERPFQCDQCERAFKNANHLKFHKMVHSGEVPFRCEICWKGFQDKVKYDRHQICHQNDNLLRCANCQIGFARVEEMTEHFEICRANENNTTPSGWVSF